jgi:hypothetical protein
MTSGVIQVWHVVIGIGALLGFVNTGFLIYDWLLRYRPIVSLSAVKGPGSTSASHVKPTLHIKNVAPFHILIERFAVKPPYCSIALTRGIRDTLITESDTPILLAPSEDRELVIIRKDSSDARKDEQIKITVRWRRGRARWLPKCPVSVRTSLDDIELRQKAAMNAAPDVEVKHQH